jgi:hypothetical protein
MVAVAFAIIMTISKNKDNKKIVKLVTALNGAAKGDC